jgi:hypothetical protein
MTTRLTRICPTMAYIDSLYAIVGQILVSRVVIKAVNIGLNSLIVRSETRIGAISRQDFVVVNPFQNIVETTELLTTIFQIIFDGLTRKSIEVRLINILFTGIED